MWWPQNRRPRRALGLLSTVLCAAPGLAQIRGQADVTMQGYYQQGGGQRLMDTSGAAFRFRSLLPGWGLLSGSLEAYGSQNQLQTGDNYLELRGAPWMGNRWTVAGGDFRFPATMVEVPFFNVFYPELTARGVTVQAVHGGREITFFWGEETLAAGPRVPFRIRTPQHVLGASAVRRFGKRFQVGARFSRFTTPPAAMLANPALFPEGRAFASVRVFTVQSGYSPVKRIRIYAEASHSAAGESGVAGAAPISTLAGAAFETSMLTVRANYTSQGTLYYPLAGFYSGDRRGPFADLRFRPWKRLEIFGSASRYSNNLERNPLITTLRSGAVSAGVSLTLPWQISASGQVSSLNYSTLSPDDGLWRNSRNLQVSAALARPFGRHTVRVNWRDLRLVTMGQPQRQRATEIEDMVRVGHVFLGGAARWQQLSADQRRNSIFLRGTAQGNLGRMSIYANVELGNDLANQTVFATNTYSTTVVGASARMASGWNVSLEYFRYHLNMILNPESIFVLETQGVGVSQTLPGFAQSSVYFKLTKQMLWGGGLPVETMDRATAALVPLTGSVDGQVATKGLTALRPAAGVPVSLDGARSATTGADGRFRFDDVAEGEHRVMLLATELPAEYDPGPAKEARVTVQARRTARADLNVLPLGVLRGRVTGPEKSLESIVIRLLPTTRYTTTGSDGQFAFYNVPEGDYEMVVDARSLPEDGVLTGEKSHMVVLRLGADAPEASFSLQIRGQVKPVRKVLELK
jgi:hypothetical protein